MTMTIYKLILICLACSLETVTIASLVVAGAADDVIKRGYRFPFTGYLPRFLPRNNSVCVILVLWHKPLLGS